MNRKVSKKDKRRLVLISFVLVFLIVTLVSSVFSDWMQILDNKKQVVYLNDTYSNLLEEETALKSEVTKLQNPDYIARYARETFLYSKPNEIIIKTDE